MSKYLSFILLTCFSTQLFAAAKICDDCSTTQMQKSAISLGSGEHLILDFERQNIKKYIVVIDELGGIPINTAIEQTVDSTTRNDFNNARAARANLELEIIRATANAGNSLSSAWEMAGNTYNQNMVGNHFVQNTTLFTSYVAYSALMLRVITLFTVDMTITVHFDDGSFAVYSLAGIQGNGDLQLTLIRAAEGNNTIPLVSQQLPGTYYVGGAGLEGLKQMTSQSGGSFTVGGTVVFGGNNDGYITECSQTGGERYECTIKND